MDIFPENNIFKELESVLDDFCIDSQMTLEEDWQQVRRGGSRAV